MTIAERILPDSPNSETSRLVSNQTELTWILSIPACSCIHQHLRLALFDRAILHIHLLNTGAGPSDRLWQGAWSRLCATHPTNLHKTSLLQGLALPCRQGAGETKRWRTDMRGGPTSSWSSHPPWSGGSGHKPQCHCLHFWPCLPRHKRYPKCKLSFHLQRQHLRFGRQQ